MRSSTRNGATHESTDPALTEFFSYVKGIDRLSLGANHDGTHEWYLTGTVFLVEIYDQAFTPAQAHAYLASGKRPPAPTTTTTTTTTITRGAPLGESFPSQVCLSGANIQGCSDSVQVNTVDSSGVQYHIVEYTGSQVLWFRHWTAGEEWKRAKTVSVSDASINFPHLTSGNYVFALRDSIKNTVLTPAPGYRKLTIPTGQPLLRMDGNMVEYHGPHALWIRPVGDAEAWARIGAYPSALRHNPLGATASGDAPAGKYLFALLDRGDNRLLARGELTIAS